MKLPRHTPPACLPPAVVQRFHFIKEGHHFFFQYQLGTELNLVDRLVRRNMVHGDPLELEFPLRQHHIADATGLTPVHVSKVLSEFRRNGLIKISERSLTILDPVGFRRIANKR